MAWLQRLLVRMGLGALALGGISSTAMAHSLEQILKRKPMVLRVAVSPGILPWLAFDEKTSALTGFEWEIAELLAKRIHPDLKLEAVQGRWQSLPRDVAQGRADLVLNGWFLPGAGEKTEGLWTECYLRTGLQVLYRDGSPKPTLEVLRTGKYKVMIFADPFPAKVLRDAGINKFTENTRDDEFDRILFGHKADYVIYDSPGVQHYAKLSGGKLIAYPSMIPGSRACYAAMAARDGEDLIAKVNEILRSTHAEKKVILSHYGITEE